MWASNDAGPPNGTAQKVDPHLSPYDGKPMVRVTLEPSDNSRHMATICECVKRAQRIGDWCTIDDLMEEMQSFRIWLCQEGRYIPYNVIGVPCIRQGALRFTERMRWDGWGPGFPGADAWPRLP